MPGVDYELDPETGDWVPDGLGGFKTTTTAAPAVMHALKDERGWPGDETAGSNFRELGTMSSVDAAAEAPNLIKGALQPLVDDGLIREVIVEVLRDRDRVFIATEIVDAAGAREDITHLTPFGE